VEEPATKALSSRKQNATGFLSWWHFADRGREYQRRLLLLLLALFRPLVLFRRLVLFLLALFLLLLFLVLPPELRRRVEAALRAEAEREDLEREAEARPPFLPPFLEELRLVFFPRPDPLFFPPPVSLFTVAQARRSASFRETPRFSYPSSICSAWRFCLFE
jgi:hypothetical protein